MNNGFYMIFFAVLICTCASQSATLLCLSSAETSTAPPNPQYAKLIIMFKVKINPHWEIKRDQGKALDTAVLLSLLRAIEETGSIARAAQAGVPRVLGWGLQRACKAEGGLALRDRSVSRGAGSRGPFRRYYARCRAVASERLFLGAASIAFSVLGPAHNVRCQMLA